MMTVRLSRCRVCQIGFSDVAITSAPAFTIPSSLQQSAVVYVHSQRLAKYSRVSNNGRERDTSKAVKHFSACLSLLLHLASYICQVTAVALAAEDFIVFIFYSPVHFLISSSSAQRPKTLSPLRQKAI